jgi:hypothetical protein
VADAVTTQAPSDVAAMQAQIQELRQRDILRDIEMARMQVYAEHPQLRSMGLLEDFQGGPDQIREFGKKLAERFPPPAPAPAPLSQAQLPAPQAPQAPPAPNALQLPVAPPAPVAPETTAVPTPSPQEILQQSSADTARADDIREKMRQGLATRAEVQWLSQWGPRRPEVLENGIQVTTGGFVSAVKEMARRQGARA